MIELWRLRYFVTVAEAGSVSRAARALGVSQSPLSQRLLELEADLGLTLFRRERKRLYLTAAGGDLLGDARALLAQSEAVERRARAAAAGSGGRLTIGYVGGAIVSGALPRVLRAFCGRHPDIAVELHALRSSEQIAALATGALDVAWLYNPPAPGAGFETRLRLEEPFLLATPLDDPLGATPVVEGSVLDGRAFICPPEQANPQARRDWLAACRSTGFTPDVRFEAAEPTTALGLVGAGLGLSLVQASARRLAPEGVSFLFLPRFPLTLRVHTAIGPQATAAARAFAEIDID